MENVTVQLETSIAMPVAEGAKLLGVSRTRLFLAIRDKQLRSFKVGKRRLVRPGDLSAWLEKHAAN